MLKWQCELGEWTGYTLRSYDTFAPVRHLNVQRVSSEFRPVHMFAHVRFRQSCMETRFIPIKMGAHCGFSQVKLKCIFH